MCPLVIVCLSTGPETKKNELMKPSTRSWWGKVDSLFCGKATPVAACHRHTAKSRLSNPKIQKNYRANTSVCSIMVGEGGFEPPKSLTTDLQSAPFGHSGIPPYSIIVLVGGAGRRIRTPDLLITNQLLYQLSYTSISATNRLYITRLRAICQ